MATILKEETIRSMAGQTDLYKAIVAEFRLENIETVRRWVRANKANGPLTTKAALAIISEKLNVPEQLLTKDAQNETHKQRTPDLDPAGTGQICETDS